jgi:hypothetical protein
MGRWAATLARIEGHTSLGVLPLQVHHGRPLGDIDLQTQFDVNVVTLLMSLGFGMSDATSLPGNGSSPTGAASHLSQTASSSSACRTWYVCCKGCSLHGRRLQAVCFEVAPHGDTTAPCGSHY